MSLNTAPSIWNVLQVSYSDIYCLSMRALIDAISGRVAKLLKVRSNTLAQFWKSIASD